MIHSGSTGTYGNATRLKEALKLLESINETLIEIFSERTGQTKEEIKKKYFDDKDHYFSAQEALDLKIIDGIYDMEPLPATAVTAEKIYDIILKRLNNKSKMDLLALLKQRPGFSACADEAAVLAHIATMEAQAEKGGRIKEPQRAVYTSLLEKDFESAKAALESLPIF
jgi:ClpP class serine protease